MIMKTKLYYKTKKIKDLDKELPKTVKDQKKATIEFVKSVDAGKPYFGVQVRKRFKKGGKFRNFVRKNY